jgi:hypothetical protein
MLATHGDKNGQTCWHTAIGVTLPLDPAPEAGVVAVRKDLLGYALKLSINPISFTPVQQKTLKNPNKTALFYPKTNLVHTCKTYINKMCMPRRSSAKAGRFPIRQ